MCYSCCWTWICLQGHIVGPSFLLRTTLEGMQHKWLITRVNKAVIKVCILASPQDLNVSQIMSSEVVGNTNSYLNVCMSVLCLLGWCPVKQIWWLHGCHLTSRENVSTLQMRNTKIIQMNTLSSEQSCQLCASVSFVIRGTCKPWCTKCVHVFL